MQDASMIPLILKSVSKPKLEVITGNMLGDGCIRFSHKNEEGKGTGNAHYCMTLSVKSYNYMLDLYNEVYKSYSLSGLKGYPNTTLPQHLNKEISQYYFNTRSIPLFTQLHSLWYTWNDKNKKYIKIVPHNIEDMFSPISLAHWIAEDGYFDNHGRTKTIILCTESFPKEDCFLLQKVLNGLGIKSSLKIRNKEEDRYRIRISKTSMPLLRDLTELHLHSDFKYKLGGQAQINM